jgi:hypothetical protein
MKWHSPRNAHERREAQTAAAGHHCLHRFKAGAGMFHVEQSEVSTGRGDDRGHAGGEELHQHGAESVALAQEF